MKTYSGIFAFILAQAFAVAMALILHNPTKEELNSLEEQKVTVTKYLYYDIS